MPVKTDLKERGSKEPHQEPSLPYRRVVSEVPKSPDSGELTFFCHRAIRGARSGIIFQTGEENLNY